MENELIDKEFLEKAEKWLLEHTEQFISDITRIVNIKSVSEYNAFVPPFGIGCQNVLKEMLKIAHEHGFKTQNYENYCGALWFEEKAETIGLWGHLDVVPEGENWEYSPYNVTVKNGYIIGRGVQDNKGPTIADMYILQCLRDLNIPLKHGIKLFFGCDEEHGMRDIEYYTKHYPCPKLSIITDCGFPVCYGEKGIIETNLVSIDTLSDDILSFCGGNASNIVPDYCEIILNKTPEILSKIENLPKTIDVIQTNSTIKLTAYGISRHVAFPDGAINAIAILCSALSESLILSDNDTKLFSLLNLVHTDFYGKGLNISCNDEISGSLTCVGSIIKLQGRHIVQHLNIRSPVTFDVNLIVSNLDEIVKINGYRQELIRSSKPNLFPKEHAAVDVLTSTYNLMTDNRLQPYVMGGGTYARMLPNAFAFGLGISKNAVAPFLKPEHGACHQPDECQNIENLIAAMKIMIMGLIDLDKLDF